MSAAAHITKMRWCRIGVGADVAHDGGVGAQVRVAGEHGLRAWAFAESNQSGTVTTAVATTAAAQSAIAGRLRRRHSSAPPIPASSASGGAICW